MNAIRRTVLVVGAVAPLVAAAGQGEAPRIVTAAEIAGAWWGTASHAGESVAFGLEVEPGGDGKLTLKITAPIVHLAHQAVGSVEFKAEGREVRLGPFVFTYDREARTLGGPLPAGLAPAHRVPVTLRRVDALPESDPRPEPACPLASPVWTFEAGSALWAGPSYADGLVFVGADDGQVHAVEARGGKKRWSFRAGGPIRTRPVVEAGELFVPADDGFLYKLAAATGELRWRARVVESKIERLPFDNPRSRYDRFGSDVVVAGGRAYLGSHDGRVLALDAARGSKLWEFRSGDSVLAAPAVGAGRVFFGSFDKSVYALDAADGSLVWKRETEGPVVSTPGLDGDRLVVGNRAYDVLGLETRSGNVAWTRYVWFSWIESSARIRDGVAYVGSSDAAAAYAFAVADGRRVWKADVRGWAWGQPGVTTERVYVGTSSQPGYLAAHEGGALALERPSGRPLWRYLAPPAKKGTYGFPGSPATGAAEGLVFFGGLDGRLYAFGE